MFGIFKSRAGEESKPRSIAGLRLFGQNRVFWFDTLFARREGQTILTIGRDALCDICLPDPTVSCTHAAIEQCSPTPNSVAPRFVIRDVGSRNGILVGALGADGPFRRVDEYVLSLGLHVRIGAIILVAVDKRGASPIACSTAGEFIGNACALYGSEQVAARFIGLSVRRMRRILAHAASRAESS